MQPSTNGFGNRRPYNYKDVLFYSIGIGTLMALISLIARAPIGYRTVFFVSAAVTACALYVYEWWRFRR